MGSLSLEEDDWRSLVRQDGEFRLSPKDAWARISHDAEAAATAVIQGALLPTPTTAPG